MSGRRGRSWRPGKWQLIVLLWSVIFVQLTGKYVDWSSLAGKLQIGSVLKSGGQGIVGAVWEEHVTYRETLKKSMGQPWYIGVVNDQDVQGGNVKIENGETKERLEYVLRDEKRELGAQEKSGEQSNILKENQNYLILQENQKVAGDNQVASAGQKTGDNQTADSITKNSQFGTSSNSNDLSTASAQETATTQTLLSQLADYDYLMKQFYSVHSSTTAGRDLMNAEKFLEYDFSLKDHQNDDSTQQVANQSTDSTDQPQILIYHTHSQEQYSDATPPEVRENGSQAGTVPIEGSVVGVGNRLTELLQEKGYQVYHDTTVYDYRNSGLDRSKAYNYALEGIQGILQKYPSIQVIIDLHRDGVRPDLHMVSEVNGKPTAQIMFFNGMSQTPEGPIEYLANPYREENLAFSFQMQMEARRLYPGLTRKIYLKGLRYNLHLRPRSLLIEVGAQTNTYAEAVNAMEPLAELLNRVLTGQQ